MTENREVANITNVFVVTMSMTMTDVFVIRTTITMTYVFVVTTRSGRLPYTGYKGQPASKIGGAGHSKQANN